MDVRSRCVANFETPSELGNLKLKAELAMPKEYDVLRGR